MHIARRFLSSVSHKVLRNDILNSRSFSDNLCYFYWTLIKSDRLTRISPRFHQRAGSEAAPRGETEPRDDTRQVINAGATVSRCTDQKPAVGQKVQSFGVVQLISGRTGDDPQLPPAPSLSSVSCGRRAELGWLQTQTVVLTFSCFVRLQL